MDESIGSQYALQVALHTLKERCQHFQERLTQLEDENVKLRMKINSSEEDNCSSVSEIGKLRQKVTELTEQKEQLQNNIAMVANENKHLWARLTKLMYLKQSLDSKLNTISGNFTKDSELRGSKDSEDDKSDNILDINGKISLDLEDISLKLISSIAKEKSELELQCSEMAELQNGKLNLENKHGFSYLIEDDNNSSNKNFEIHIDKLKNIKIQLLQQKDELQKNLKNIQQINTHCKKCQKAVLKTDSKSTLTSFPKLEVADYEEQLQLESLSKWATPENSSTFIDNKFFTVTGAKLNNIKKDASQEVDKICPMCCEIFGSKVPFLEFQHHVEAHFIENIVN
ncbi:protein spindle-F [Agrilus planipennis]|uniref:Protein spindle-F n=1 Tax=Agrilus planipennis TaxID=224129 RepID=A0A1W4WGM6_AGRPL|nr:protein spindle-F [Agrilus planipennis]